MLCKECKKEIINNYEKTLRNRLTEEEKQEIIEQYEKYSVELFVCDDCYRKTVNSK